jgi:hypothetical protein
MQQLNLVAATCRNANGEIKQKYGDICLIMLLVLFEQASLEIVRLQKKAGQMGGCLCYAS